MDWNKESLGDLAQVECGPIRLYSDQRVEGSHWSGSRQLPDNFASNCRCNYTKLLDNYLEQFSSEQ